MAILHLDRELMSPGKWVQGNADEIWAKVDKMAVAHIGIRDVGYMPYRVARGEFGDEVTFVAPDGEDVYLIPGTPEEVKAILFM